MKIGEKIRRLRQENGLTQEELASRCELSKGFISQVEREMTSPSITSLVDILESLGTNLKEFFDDDDDEEKIAFGDKDFFESYDESLKYKVEWIVPNAQKNSMEPILLTIEPGGSFYEDNAHAGEEFGYVLSGEVVLKYGDRKIRAKQGETFYYLTDRDHTLINESKRIAKVLMVATPPNF